MMQLFSQVLPLSATTTAAAEDEKFFASGPVGAGNGTIIPILQAFFELRQVRSKNKMGTMWEIVSKIHVLGPLFDAGSCW